VVRGCEGEHIVVVRGCEGEHIVVVRGCEGKYKTATIETFRTALHVCKCACV
jgi:hypothetical protein